MCAVGGREVWHVCLFVCQVREVDPLKEKLVLEQITWRLDKLENDTLPQVDLNVTEVRVQVGVVIYGMEVQVWVCQGLYKGRCVIINVCIVYVMVYIEGVFVKSE